MSVKKSVGLGLWISDKTNACHVCYGSIVIQFPRMRSLFTFGGVCNLR